MVAHGQRATARVKKTDGGGWRSSISVGREGCECRGDRRLGGAEGGRTASKQLSQQ